MLPRSYNAMWWNETKKIPHLVDQKSCSEKLQPYLSVTNRTLSNFFSLIFSVNVIKALHIPQTNASDSNFKKSEIPLWKLY